MVSTCRGRFLAHAFTLARDGPELELGGKLGVNSVAAAGGRGEVGVELHDSIPSIALNEWYEG